MGECYPHTWVDARGAPGWAAATPPPPHVLFPRHGRWDRPQRGEFFAQGQPDHAPCRVARQRIPGCRSTTCRRGAARLYDLANRHLEQAGSVQRIGDPRSLQIGALAGWNRSSISGHDIGATRPTRWTARRAARDAIRPQEQQAAREEWERRKVVLGSVPIAAQWQEARAVTLQQGPQPAPGALARPQVSRELQAVAQQIAATQQQVSRTHAAIRMEEYRLRTGYDSPAPRAAIHRMTPPDAGPAQRARDAGGFAAPIDKHAQLERPLIGNVLSRIYHTPGQPNYGEVQPRNQVKFWTIAAAEAAGYRPAHNDRLQPWSRAPPGTTDAAGHRRGWGERLGAGDENPGSGGGGGEAGGGDTARPHLDTEKEWRRGRGW